MKQVTPHVIPSGSEGSPSCNSNATLATARDDMLSGELLQQFDIYAFYRFVAMPHFEQLREVLLAKMHQHNILGSILIADEGINGTIAGLSDDIKIFWQFLCSYPEFNDLAYKITHDDMNPFDKAKVKLRKEIVTLGVEAVHPPKGAGEYVKPDEWNKLLEDPEVLVIDTRNTYEIEHGSFKNAINPQTKHFRDFPKFARKNLLDKKDKKIAMYCTGVIRCEKSTAYLKELGFDIYEIVDKKPEFLKHVQDKKILELGKDWVNLFFKKPYGICA